jgi:restriction endonuclease Mrr
MPPELYLPILKLLAEEEMTVSQLADRLAPRFKVSESERRQRMGKSRQMTFENHLRQAIRWLKDTDEYPCLIDGRKESSYRPTDLGRLIVARNPEVLTKESLRSVPEWRAWEEAKPNGTGRKSTKAGASLARPHNLVGCRANRYQADFL